MDVNRYPSPEELLPAALATQRLAVLCSTGNSQPHGSLVAFALTPDQHTAIFTTRRATRKYENLLRQPCAALVVDNRRSGTAIGRNTVAATISGKVREVHGRQRDSALKLFLAEHPDLAEFAEAPETAVFELDIEHCHIAGNFPAAELSEQ
jgi:nitroimidazol reductase NimA-like FMN-containing flavoprotein (pyridoxamine 5'-phosphate oxidase superfamily)